MKLDKKSFLDLEYSISTEKNVKQMLTKSFDDFLLKSFDPDVSLTSLRLILNFYYRVSLDGDGAETGKSLNQVVA